MKVILSRKGLDSQYGGIPSPIIQTEHGLRFFPIPIPREGSNIKFCDLRLYDKFTVSDFLRDIPLKFTRSNTCHLDPDIRNGYLNERPVGWMPAFGQSRTAQDHLMNCGIGAGDVFLFFGWFQYAECTENGFQFVKSTDYPKGFHAIYGYLQVDKMYDLKQSTPIPEWLESHPHAKYKSIDIYNNRSNVIYTANRLFSFNDQKFEKNGSALFCFKEDLILTKKGQPNRTQWELPKIFHPDNGVEISYNPTKNWGLINGKASLRSASKGQEFVVNADPKGKIEQWCYDLIMSHSVAD